MEQADISLHIKAHIAANVSMAQLQFLCDRRVKKPLLAGLGVEPRTARRKGGSVMETNSNTDTRADPAPETVAAVADASGGDTAEVRDETVMVKIDEIKIPPRHRRDMGDLQALAESIRDEGLLEPIGVTEGRDLVFGERRLRAARDILAWWEIPARVVRVTSLLKGERDENEVRKDFTISERVAIGKALELQIGNRKGQRTDLAPRENFPEVDSCPGERTSETAARFAGFGNRKTYEQANCVIEQGALELVEAVDKKFISVSLAKKMLALPAEEQARIGGECIKGHNSKQATKALLRRQNKHHPARTGVLSMAGLLKVAVVHADPLRAWQGNGQRQCDASELSKIKALGENLAEHLPPDALLFLWVPGALIISEAQAREVVKACGFEYHARMVTVVKSQPKRGNYVRYDHTKLLLIGTRGTPLDEETCETIERTCPDSPQLSLFGRIEGAGCSSRHDGVADGAQGDKAA
jgi:hypothetical protein